MGDMFSACGTAWHTGSWEDGVGVVTTGAGMEFTEKL